jgi:small subunit ribosomal protein S1
MHEENFDQEEKDTGEDFAAMLEASLTTAPRLELGQKTEAKILQIGPDWTFLDVGQKGEGVLDTNELRDGEGQLKFAVGDRISAYYVSHDGGEMRFTTRIGSGSAGNAQLEEAWRSGIPVDGRVEQEIKGGYEVKLPGNLRSFCPYSQIALRRLDNPAEVIGQTFSFKISQFGENGRNIVVSRRELLEAERREQRESLKESLKEGMLVTGEVTSLRDFGAFIDIGGIEGLLPISEIAYGRIENIHDVLQVGQTLELAVKRLDWEENKFSFSLRDTLADPWKAAADRYPAGTKLQGTVTRLAQFGAFVALEEGIEGLIHISKLGQGKRISHPREVIKVGAQVEVTVEKVEIEQRRISLALGDGVSEEVGEKSYTDQPAGSGMGTLGDLLKAGQHKKDRSRKKR